MKRQRVREYWEAMAYPDRLEIEGLHPCTAGARWDELNEQEIRLVAEHMWEVRNAKP